MILAMLPALMIGFRYEVGTDWGAYSDMFDEIARRDLGWALSRIDPGYGALNWLVAKAGGSFWVVNLVCGALFIFGLVRFARVQPNPWLAIVVAIPYLVIGVGMGYSRQAVAVGLLMAGFAALSRGSFARFVFWVIAGALFHRTAVVLIPIVTLTFSRNRFQAITIGLAGCILGYYVLTSAQGLEHLQRAYVNRGYESQGAGIRLAMNFPPAIMYLGFSRRFARDEVERRTWLIFALIAVGSFASYFFLLTSSTALDRMSLYIIPLQLFVLSRLPTAFSSGTRQSAMLTAIVIFYSALVEFVWLNYSNNAVNWVPYQLYPLT